MILRLTSTAAMRAKHSIPQHLQLDRPASPSRFDVAISVAGPDAEALDFAERLTVRLSRSRIKAYFYLGLDEESESLGRSLRPFLQELYGKRARQVVVIESHRYGETPLTLAEWRWISERRRREPRDDFLVPVRLSVSNVLGREFGELGFLAIDTTDARQVDRLARLVLWRLGVRSWIRAATSLTALIAAVGVFAYRCARAPFPPSWVTALGVATIVSAALWAALFYALPRILNDGRRGGWYRKLLRSRAIEGAMLAPVLLASVAGIIAVGTWREQLARASAAWLGGTPTERVTALSFFTHGVKADDAFDHWVRMLRERPDTDPVLRGRALEILCRLEPKLSSRLRAAASLGQAGLTPETWRALSLNADLSSVKLDGSGLEELQFTGTAPNWVATSAKRVDLSAAWFDVVDMASADLRWSDLARLQAVAVTGPAHFSGAQLQRATFFGCDLAGTTFAHADLTGAKFTRCALTGCDFGNSGLVGVTFEDCDLRGAVFGGPVRHLGVWGRLSGLTFVRCNLAGIDFGEANFGPAGVPLIPRPCAGRTDPREPSTVVMDGSVGDPPAASAGSVTRVAVSGAVLIDCRFAGDDALRLADPPSPPGPAISRLASAWRFDLRDDLEIDRIRSLLLAPGGVLADRVSKMGLSLRATSLPATRFRAANFKGVWLDAASWNAMSEEQRRDAVAGGFDQGTVISPASDSGALETRFPQLRARRWSVYEAVARGASR